MPERAPAKRQAEYGDIYAICRLLAESQGHLARTEKDMCNKLTTRAMTSCRTLCLSAQVSFGCAAHSICLPNHFRGGPCISNASTAIKTRPVQAHAVSGEAICRGNRTQALQTLYCPPLHTGQLCTLSTSRPAGRSAGGHFTVLQRTRERHLRQCLRSAGHGVAGGREGQTPLTRCHVQDRHCERALQSLSGMLPLSQRSRPC